MIRGGSLFGWVLALAIDGTIFAAFGVSMVLALEGTRNYLRRREVRDFSMGAVIFLAFCGWCPNLTAPAE